MTERESQTHWLTVKEAAEYLRIKPRKLYDLVANQKIPYSRVGTKLVFNPHALDEHIALQERPVMPGLRAAQLPVIAGSHDPLLEWAVRQSGADIALMLRGSSDGLAQMQKAQANAALVHLPASDLQSFNLHAVAQAARGHAWVLLHFASRQQGFITRTRQQAVKTIAQLYSSEPRTAAPLRIGRRQEGAGSRMLLDLLLDQYELTHRLSKRHRTYVWVDEFKSESELAQAIRAGDIDLGLGIRAGLSSMGLHFEPQLVESLDLLIDRRAYFEPSYQTLLKFCAGTAFKAHAKALTGYETQRTGEVRWNA